MVHRPPALKPSGPGTWGLLIALAVLEASWFAWFVLEPLPNIGAVAEGRPVTRLGLLVRALPQIIPGVRFHESYLGIAAENLSHVENLPGRLPIVLAAGWIAASAVSLGLLILRGLQIGPGFGLFERLGLGFGLGTVGIGLATLAAGRLGLLSPWAVRIGLGFPILAALTLAIRDRRGRLGFVPPKPGPGLIPPMAGAWHGVDPASVVPWIGFVLVVGPFLLILFLGAMLPCIDFDALEYHLQGPKEYYQAGRITFLPHNVYTSMPFGVEMIHLVGMELVDDWWLGALVGQVVVAGFAPASAALVAMTALRLGSPRAAWVAAAVYLTTPWVYRLGVLPYVEGPLCYFHAALVWAWTWTWARESVKKVLDRPPISSAVLMGLLAGGAMATKYPALISAVVPASAWAAWMAWRLRSWRFAVGFGSGLVVVIGPWLGKNWLDTGNPVYPLGYSVFGGPLWDSDRDARWKAVHGPKPIEAVALVRSFVEVAGRSDWQSPLYTALIPLVFLRNGSRRAVGWLLGFSAYLFLTWWLLTHRLDRFWLPILPSLAVLAGLGADWCRKKEWTMVLAVVMAAGIGSNLVYCSTALAGLNDWTGDLQSLRVSIPRLLNPPMARLDAELPEGARPLMVGQAGVFHLNHRVAYNTVFDNDILEGLAKGRTPEEVRGGLARMGVTHVYVDWSEIERYRSPGNYGFTSYVTPEVFDRLVRAGVLKPPMRPGPRQELFEVRPKP